jgi:hypothetical protein
MKQIQIDSMQGIFGHLSPYGSNFSDNLMHALGFTKRRKKMIVVFAKAAETEITAFSDSRGHNLCSAGDLIIRRETAPDLFDQWSVEKNIFSTTYTVLGGYQTNSPQEARWMEEGFLPCYKSSWQWMQLICPEDSSTLIIPQLEKTERPFHLTGWGWLNVGVKGEMWVVPWDTGRDQYEDAE